MLNSSLKWTGKCSAVKYL